MKMKIIIRLTIIILSLTIVSNVKGINMESPNYRIQFGNINSASGRQKSEGYSLTDTLGQLAANKFNSDGYIIKAGFEYLHSIIPFRFAVSDTTINLGSINPNTFSTAKTNLTVSFGSSGSYQVTAQENGPLSNLSGNIIPNTLCDGVSDTCTESIAKPWTSVNHFGFGYNIAGDDISSDFQSIDYYRPFADLLANKRPVPIMSSSNVGKNRHATVTFKVNVSPDQLAGTYQTVVDFIATPGY